MTRKLQIFIAWMGVVAVITGAYRERLGLPPSFEDFAIFGVVPVVLILVLLLRRYSRADSDTADFPGKLRRLWDHKRKPYLVRRCHLGRSRARIGFGPAEVSYVASEQHRHLRFRIPARRRCGSRCSSIATPVTPNQSMKRAAPW